MSDRDSGRILLIDHSRGALIFQETLLRRRTSSIVTALAASEGLEKTREHKPHLIIFPFDMFDMTAPEFCRVIRNDDATRSTSLLLVGDRDHPEQVDLCMAAGCNDVVFKPLGRRELDQKVQKLTTIPVRRQLRTITRIEVSLENNGRFILGRSVNVSASGMLLEVERVMPGDGDVRVHFYLPGDPQPLQVSAHVVRAEFSGSMARYGVHFDEITGEEQERIEQYVNRIRSRELL